MNTPVKLAGFGIGLVAVFGAAVGVGAAVGPVGPIGEQPSPAAPAPAHDDADRTGGTHEEHGP